MGILSGKEIERQIALGNIVITPAPARINPNSVNLRLGPKLLVYDRGHFPLDFRKDNPTFEETIGPDGFVLRPETLYLASTLEYTETRGGLVPKIEGRSSVGRMGVFCHVTAGFGDNGFCGAFTLELLAVHPVRVYAGMELCQISYLTLVGEPTEYRGKYQGDRGPVASRMHLEQLDKAG